jgi:hypothetical protein
VSVHEALLQEFREVVQKLRGRHSLDNQAEAILKVKASSLSERHAFSAVGGFRIRCPLLLNKNLGRSLKPW